MNYNFNRIFIPIHIPVIWSLPFPFPKVPKFFLLTPGGAKNTANIYGFLRSLKILQMFKCRINYT